MKNDFRKMEDEMDHLATNMAAITEFSARISSTLQDRRQQITKLSGVHTLLKKVPWAVNEGLNITQNPVKRFQNLLSSTVL